MLERHDCSGLQDALSGDPGQELWQALAAVCAAAVDGDRAQWAIARDLAAAGAGGAASSCLEEAAQDLLARALSWHERHPDAHPAVRFPASGTGTACPFRIDAVVVVDETGTAVPGDLEGPLAGGTLLQVTGQGLNGLTAATVGGRPAEVVPALFVESGLVLRTPPADAPQTAQIALQNRAGVVLAAQQFRYVGAEAASGLEGAAGRQ